MGAALKEQIVLERSSDKSVSGPRRRALRSDAYALSRCRISSCVRALALVLSVGLVGVIVVHEDSSAATGSSSTDSATTTPLLSIGSPSDGEPLSAIVEVEVSLSDIRSSMSLALYLDGTQISAQSVQGDGDYSFEFDSSSYSRGKKTIGVSLIRSNGTVATSGTVEVEFVRPELTVSSRALGALVGGISEWDVTFGIDASAGDSAFVILVSQSLENSDYSTYGLRLPIDSETAVEYCAGQFSKTYSGSVLSHTKRMRATSSTAPKFYAVLLVWNSEIGWSASGSVEVKL